MMLLRTFLGSVALYAATARLFDQRRMCIEADVLGIPHFFGYGIILIELWVGLTFLTQANLSLAAYTACLGLISATALIISRHYAKILETVPDIYTYQPTAMCIALHVMYIFMIYYLISTTSTG